MIRICPRPEAWRKSSTRKAGAGKINDADFPIPAGKTGKRRSKGRRALGKLREGQPGALQGRSPDFPSFPRLDVQHFQTVFHLGPGFGKTRHE